ncbi:electron transfer flavoprotein subunit alpha/FixB family protein [Cellulomonas sp. URHD0024]|uniref:electron transfer flavoprotein subunit alpha/FixB family protein n=1 Tax=Cellulomonas sp. URHD0024 TaxID=1302620 RepID=UPI000480E958|nr:electron transfer flavoprotein subunit alpha/FixB family protein [Cellulomonas sp. URHD0024]
MTASVLVLLDHTEAGALRAPVRELLTLARSLAGAEAVHAAWALDGVEPSASVLEEVASLGATHVHRLSADADLHLSAVLAEALASLLDATGAGLLLLESSFENSEAAARLAVTTGAGVITDADALSLVDGRFVAAKTVFAGTWNTSCAITAPLAIVTVKPNSVVVSSVAAAAPVVSEHAVAVSDKARRVTLVERTVRPESGRPDLGSASVVVAGGRGTEGDFSLVEELADVIGGAVGATRVATDEGWIGHDAQIGQTGVTIAPKLYVGVGVSGAVHHRGGMQASGTIVAINSDPDAPIFEIADFGVVGDLFTVLPQAVAELRRLKG